MSVYLEQSRSPIHHHWKKGDHPEMDNSEELEIEGIKIYQ